MNTDLIITEDVLIDMFPKYMDFFDINNFKACNKNFHKKIKYGDFNNKYLDINKVLFDVLNNNNIERLKLLEKIFPISEIIENNIQYLFVIYDIEMFKYIEKNYIYKMDDSFRIYEKYMKQYTNYGFFELVKYVFGKLNETKDWRFKNNDFMEAILYTMNSEIAIYVLENLENPNDFIESFGENIFILFETYTFKKLSQVNKNDIVDELILIIKKYNIENFHLDGIQNDWLMSILIEINNTKLMNFFKTYFFDMYNNLNKYDLLLSSFIQGKFFSFVWLFNEINFINEDENFIINDDVLFDIEYDTKFEIKEWLYENNHIKNYEKHIDKIYIDKVVESGNINHFKKIYPKFKHFIDELTLEKAIICSNTEIINFLTKFIPDLKNSFKKLFTKFCYNMNQYKPVNIVLYFINHDKIDVGYLEILKNQDFSGIGDNDIYEIMIWAIKENFLETIKWLFETNNIITRKDFFVESIYSRNLDIFTLLYDNLKFENDWLKELYLLCCSTSSLEILKFLYEKYNISEDVIKSSFDKLMFNFEIMDWWINQKFIKWMSNTRYKKYFDNKNKIRIFIGSLIKLRTYRIHEERIIHRVIL